MTQPTIPNPGRRAFFKQLGRGAAATTAAVTLGGSAGPALATTGGGDTVSINGAGFYRFALGRKTITVLADGNALFPGQELFAVDASPEEFAEVQGRFLQPAGNAEIAMNTLLIEEDGRKILIDAGPGHFLGDSFGRQALALRNAGVDPAEIDTVIITHGHADHFGGLVDKDMNLRFPKARIIWNEREWAYWSSERSVKDVRASAQPEGFKDFFINVPKAVLPVAAPNVDRLDVRSEHEVAPGVLLLAAPGHSFASMVVLIESEGKQLLYASDTTLLVKQNTVAPEWVSAFEYDGPSLIDTRKRLLDRAAADGIAWFGYHAHFPALGGIRRTGSGFEFVETPWRW